MSDYEKIVRIKEIYERLQDEESKKIFEARISLMVHGDRIAFWDCIKEKDWYALNLMNSAYLVFGAGKMGLYIREQLELAGKNIIAFLENDNSKVGQVIDQIPIISVRDAWKYENIPIVISNREYEKEMRQQLESLKLTNPMIKEEEICLFCGTQYFDYFSPCQREILVDAGAYDGGTIRDFIKWSDGNYEKIYSFEPDKMNYDRCKQYLEMEHVPRVQLISKGTYSSEAVLRFDASGDGGSHIGEDGKSTVEVTTIDLILDGKEVTLIKMDVEGCEMESLYGAEKTIRKYKPRLAVCVYHKTFDFVEIPLLLLEMNPDYKFALRHYASNLCETVLYAW